MSLSEALKVCVILVISIFYQANSQNISIIRGERDVFTNLKTCKLAKAVCLNETDCSYCQCRSKNSFVKTRGSYGECVPNEFLVSVTSYNSTFLVQDTTKNRCLNYWKPNDYRFVYENVECSTSVRSRQYRWLWTNTGQLLHLDLLQCVTVGWKYSRKYTFLLLEKCEPNNNKQLWKCLRNDPYYFWHEQSKEYMHQGNYGDYVLSYQNREKARKWKRYGSNQTLCSQAVGCDTFEDGSSLLVLNQTTTCQQKPACSSEKEINVGLTNVTECFLLPNQTQYIHDEEWKPLLPKKEGFDVLSSENKVFLKWDLTKTPKSWKGLIVKVKFRCRNSARDENAEQIHCVLIKYAGLFTGFDELHGNDKQSGKEEKSQTTVIIVCILVIAIIIGVIVFVGYRNKNRLANFLAKTKVTGKTKDSSPGPGQTSGASTNPIYHSSNTQSAQNQCELYETATPESIYQNANAGHKTEMQSPPTVTYDYASPDDRPRIGQRACAPGHSTEGIKIHKNASEQENTVHNPPIYHVLESN